MSLWFNKTISPVKYKRSGNYSLSSDVPITSDAIKEAQKRGKTDAETNPFDVSRTKATEYEKELQKGYEKKIGIRTNLNISRSEKWGSLISVELKNILIPKKAYEAKLKERKFMLSDSKFGIIVYAIIVILVGLPEMAINITVFDIFGENLIFTCLTAGIVTIVLFMVAHYIGGCLKSEGFKAQSFFCFWLFLF